jgi:hydroxyacylglutathione hydrolase
MMEQYGGINVNNDATTTTVHELKTSFGFIVNYSYLIQYHNTKDIIIVDPSWELEKITAFIHANNFCVIGIFLTHSHIDHSNLANPLSEIFDCKVYITAIESQVYNFNCNNLIHIHTEENIIINEFSIKPVFTPGHTKGSCCYLIDRSFFTGDTLFIEGCGTCDDIGANPYDMYDSLQKIKALLHENHKIYPGHRYKRELGLPFSTVLKNNIYLQIENVKHFVDFRMRMNQRGHLNFI